MKKPNSADETDMRAEYDFSEKHGVRGKYYHPYQAGHAVRVHLEDGTVTTHYFTLEEGAVLLAPDVRAYFPDSESVNQALRGLIELIPRDKQGLTQTG
jgi:hypothetical protein